MRVHTAETGATRGLRLNFRSESSEFLELAEKFAVFNFHCSQRTSLDGLAVDSGERTPTMVMYAAGMSKRSSSENAGIPDDKSFAPRVARAYLANPLAVALGLSVRITLRAAGQRERLNKKNLQKNL